MKTTAIVCALLLALYATICTAFPFFPDKTRCTQNSKGLTTTNWQQMGGFEQCTPDSLRLGCWSTALAQIMYYHRLKPYGRVQYTSRKGYRIDEVLDSTQFDFRQFAPTIDSNSSPATAAQLAKYNYYAALAIQKDFGTDRYMNKLAPASLLEQHYQVKVKRYIAWHNFAPYTLGKLEKIIYRELNEQRPVFLHFANLKDFGHSVVIDAYCYENGKFKVHLNQGQGGPTDGWYDFYKGILRPDDTVLRVIYTFNPDSHKRSH